tara:strand:+ start:662524 stop:663765 length:1242 start_codon:yes stop_codon:yes gene_type:complete
MSAHLLNDLVLERKIAVEQSRVLRSPEAIRRRKLLLFLPHVQPLNGMVQKWNGDGLLVPWFDPIEGGVDAEILILLQSPGPKADREKGSGFISPDNNDMSAQRMWEAYRDVGIPRGKIISWNIVPWYIGLQSPKAVELQNGSQYLQSILDFLPQLRTVVLVGEKARVAWFRHMDEKIDTNRYEVKHCIHPRARTFTKRIESSIRLALSSLGHESQNHVSEKSKSGYESLLPTDSKLIWREVFSRQRAFAMHAFDQLDDNQFFTILAPGLNSCAIIANHLAGNMQSRWTDFLTTDGEKTTRDRDHEFDHPPAHTKDERAKIMARFDQGWTVLFSELDSLTNADLNKIITIRSVEHTVNAAVIRQIDHYSFHIGQINIIARQLVGTADWKWFTLAPEATKSFNEKLMGDSKTKAQ